MKTVDINTAQNVTITYDLAVLWQRILAFILDFVIVFVSAWLSAFLLYGIFWLIIFILILSIGPPSIGSLLWGGFPFVFIAYFTLSTLKLNGQTLGKRAMNLKVMKYNGQPLQLGDALLRDLFLFLEALMTLGTLGSLIIGATDRNQRLGDILANTVVIKKQNAYHVTLKGLLARKTSADYQAAFPEVVRLPENDLLMVNEALERARNYPSDAHLQALDELASLIEKKLHVDRGNQSARPFLQQLSRDYVVLTR
jgi:uncharacterized RDD family membrane protein YckC